MRSRRGVRLVHCSSHAALVKHPLSSRSTNRNRSQLADPCDYHRSKAQAEQLVLDLARDRALDAVVASPGTLTGPNDFKPSIMGRALIDLYHRQIPILMEVLTDYVDSRDVAAGMIAAAERGRSANATCSPDTCSSSAKWSAFWGELTGVRMPNRVLPLWAGLDDAPAYAGGGAPGPTPAALHRRGAPRQCLEPRRLARQSRARARLFAAPGARFPGRRACLLPGGRLAPSGELECVSSVPGARARDFYPESR